MVATSGDRLLDEMRKDAIAVRLVPSRTLVTPNLDEAAILAGFDVAFDPAAMRRRHGRSWTPVPARRWSRAGT
jgi:hydroxymethylpyrimidine/phosphomethylpyrimidine kinase